MPFPKMKMVYFCIKTTQDFQDYFWQRFWRGFIFSSKNCRPHFTHQAECNRTMSTYKSHYVCPLEWWKCFFPDHFPIEWPVIEQKKEREKTQSKKWRWHAKCKMETSYFSPPEKKSHIANGWEVRFEFPINRQRNRNVKRRLGFFCVLHSTLTTIEKNRINSRKNINVSSFF